jgi:serine/threonine-protein phosphatase PGAM5
MRLSICLVSPRRRVVVAALCALALAEGTSVAAARQATTAAAPTAVYRTLYLVRHGEYDHDDPRDERVGKALVPVGVAQARLLGARLRALPVRFAAFRSSPLTRALQTARVLALDLPEPPLAIDPNLAECTPPTRRAEVTAGDSPESLAACRAQLERLVAEWLKPVREERHDLLVAHGNVIRYLVTRALGVDPTAWLEMSIGNASLTVIRVEPDGRFKVLAVGDVGHLPPSFHSGRTGDPERDLEAPGAPAPEAH